MEMETTKVSGSGGGCGHQSFNRKSYTHMGRVESDFIQENMNEWETYFLYNASYISL